MITDAQSRSRPGEAKALEAYVAQAPDHGHRAEVVDVAAFQDLPRFDAAFLRLDTNVLGLSFAASRYAWELGLRVVDDPRSLLTCMNKAHTHWLLEREGVPTPETRLLTREELEEVDAGALLEELGAPVVCKAPSGAFSRAVERAHSAEELRGLIRRFRQQSDVLLCQRFTASTYDWRIGVLCGRVLYAARYHIPKGAWRIHDTPEGEQRKQWARVEPVPVEETPVEVLEVAKRATEPIGSSLYGVDLKQLEDGRVVVIEVNDNPTIDWDQELPAGSPVFGEIVDLVATQGPRRGQADPARV